MSRWRRFWRLSPEDRLALLQATILLPLTVAGLRLFGLRQWQSFLGRWGGSSRATPPAAGELLERAQSFSRMVAAASREGLVKGNCLSRSLLLWWLLRREGAEARLRIGVRPTPAGVEAHAWVELDGVVLNDTQDVHQQFPPFEGEIVPADLQLR